MPFCRKRFVFASSILCSRLQERDAQTHVTDQAASGALTQAQEVRLASPPSLRRYEPSTYSVSLEQVNKLHNKILGATTNTFWNFVHFEF